MSGAPFMQDRTAVSVIIPTYREAANLESLCNRICAVFDAANLNGEIVLVDDDSGDGTDTIAEQLARQCPVQLIVRKGERGLASAVLRGFREARHDVFVVMDADLSHPPERIPALLQPLLSGEADFVIGSRYCPGASTADDWGLWRRVNSWFATALAWPLTPARDPMAGFFCLHRKTWQRATQLNPIGYKIGLELIVKCGCSHVREVPIAFSDRLHGHSKLTLRQQWHYLRHLWRLYRYRYPWLPIALVCAIAVVVLIVVLARGTLP